MPIGFGRSILSKTAAAAAEPSRTAMNISFVTLTGGAVTEISTDQAKFGSSSLHVTATATGDDGGLVVDGGTTAIDLSGDFTIEWFMRYDNALTTTFPNHKFLDTRVSGDSTLSEHILIDTNDDTGTPGGPVSLRFFVGASAPDHTVADFVADPLDWQHLAISRTGSTVEMYLDGTRVHSKTTSADFTLDYDFNLFHRNTGGAESLATAYIDDFRISTTGRYTGASITVPTAAFTNDADTALLLHFEGADGARTTTDDNA